MSRIPRRVRTFSGSCARGCTGVTELAGTEKRERLADPATAKSGGRAAEKTKAGELVR